MSTAGINLLNQLLTYDPDRRISASRALRHPWFTQLPAAVKPENMPVFPSTQDAHNSSSKRSALIGIEDKPGISPLTVLSLVLAG